MAASPIATAAPTFADLLWPVRSSPTAKAARGAALVLAGACILTVSAKLQVPGPVPMTLQTLAVLALGGLLGARLAVAAVILYVVQGALGLPVFANTPPQAAGLAYLLGPTGGFLLGFVAAAFVAGLAADRGLARRPLAFGAVLATGLALLLATGWLWLALWATLSGGTGGIGLASAFEVGVRPFLLGEALKLAIAAASLPAIHAASARYRAR